MKLEWMGAYRDIVGDFYRSANGYSQICKTELFGDKIRFSAEQHKNMKWYAERLGLSQATLSKYVRKLVDKGLLEKYHREGNRKDIILMVSPLGLEEYERYSQQMKAAIFDELFHLLDSISPEELEIVKKVFAIYGHWHRESLKSPKDRPVSLIKVEGR